MVRRQQLIEWCAHEQMRSSLECLPARARIVRCIVLRNILTGRVVHQIRAQASADLQRWLCGYTHRVATFYQNEHTEWLRLLQPQAGNDLYDKLLTYARGHCQALMVAGYGGTDLETEDVANEAYVRLYNGRLARYPFDLSLDEWVDRHVRQCAQRLAQLRCPGCQVPYDTLDEDVIPSLDTTSQDWLRIEWSDLRCDVDGLDLSVIDRLVLQMWYHGYSLDETSRRVGLSSKAVSHRRRRIARRLAVEAME